MLEMPIFIRASNVVLGAGLPMKVSLSTPQLQSCAACTMLVPNHVCSAPVTAGMPQGPLLQLRFARVWSDRAFASRLLLVVCLQRARPASECRRCRSKQPQETTVEFRLPVHFHDHAVTNRRPPRRSDDSRSRDLVA